MALDQVIRELRSSAGYSQREFAKRLEINPAYLSRLESGAREPSLTLLRRMARETSAPFAVFLIGALLPETPQGERGSYEAILESLLQLAKHRQLHLDLNQGNGEPAGA